MPPLMIKDIHDDNSVIVNTLTCARRPQKQRQVRFSRTKRVLRIPLASTFSREEIKSTWYSRKELRSIKRKAQGTVQLLTTNPEEVSRRKGLCGAGLSSIDELLERQDVRKEAQNAVLEEQRFQQLQASPNDDILANLYSIYTRRSQLDALERAHDHVA